MRRIFTFEAQPFGGYAQWESADRADGFEFAFAEDAELFDEGELADEAAFADEGESAHGVQLEKAVKRPAPARRRSPTPVMARRPTPVKPFVILQQFAFKGTTMPASHNNLITRIAHLLLASRRIGAPIRIVRLVGHTDPSGSDSFNLELGRKRAADVRQRLISELDRLQPGASASVRIVPSSRGESRPIAPNTTAGAPLNRRVEIFLPSTCQTFFAQYDLRFLPGDAILGIPAHPNIADKSGRETKVLGVARGLLEGRMNTRATLALSGTIAPALAVSVAASPMVHADVTELSKLQLDLFREYLPGRIHGINFSRLQECFEKFANGELRSPHAAFSGVGVGEPEGSFFFLFAEFAFVCVDSNIDKAPWLRALRAFVKAQEIFMHVYHPMPAAPPRVGAPLPAAGAALTALDLYKFGNFKQIGTSVTRGTGQSNAARKRDLRRKYDSMGLNELRAAASQNMLRAQRMR